MTARLCQYLIAAVFLCLGGWALVAPASVIDLALTRPYRDDGFILRFAIACFGAQAVMFGIMALVVEWKARAFATFAVVLVPFFVFNWYFHYQMPVLTSIGMLDFAGNVVMFIACIAGWRASRAQARRRSGILSL